MPELRWLRLMSLVEVATLLILVVNLVTLHHAQVAAGVGPLHGFAYLATIATSFLLPLPRSIRAWTFLPGVGGILAVWRARRHGAASSGAAGEQDT